MLNQYLGNSLTLIKKSEKIATTLHTLCKTLNYKLHMFYTSSLKLVPKFLAHDGNGINTNQESNFQIAQSQGSRQLQFVFNQHHI